MFAILTIAVVPTPTPIVVLSDSIKVTPPIEVLPVLSKLSSRLYEIAAI